MTTPRIGDTVHYVPATQRFTGQCLAALIVNNTNSPDITAMAWTPEGHAYIVEAGFDSAPIGNTRTPGTWHHTH